MKYPPEKFTPAPHYIGHKPTEVVRQEGFDPTKNLERGAWGNGYDYEHAHRARFYKREIEMSNRDITRLQKRLDAWKPQK